MDYKEEALKKSYQLAIITVKNHGGECLCWECQQAESAIAKYQQYRKLKQQMEEI